MQVSTEGGAQDDRDDGCRAFRCDSPHWSQRRDCLVRNVLRSGLILFITDLFHPGNGLAIKLFLKSDMGYGSGWRSAMPVFLRRRAPDHVPWMNLLDRTIPALRAAAPSGHEQGLAQRVGVPSSASTRLECHTGTLHTRRIGYLKQRITADRTGKILSRSFARRL